MYFMHINVSGRSVLLFNKLIDWFSSVVAVYLPASLKLIEDVCICDVKQLIYCRTLPGWN